MPKVHRRYRRPMVVDIWRRFVPPSELTTRHYQAMCNFASEGVSLPSIAEMFGCSAAHVEEEIILTDHFGYRRRSRLNRASDWGAGPDALKTFRQVLTTLEQSSHQEMTWQEYLDSVDWNEAYECYGDRAVEVVKEKAQEIADKSDIELVWK